MRRRYRWEEIAAKARSTPGVWRQHPDLIAVTEHLYRHARRRVAALEPTTQGRFRFKRGQRGYDEMGATVFDLKVMYEETPNVNERAQGTQEVRREVPAEAGEDPDHYPHAES